MSEKKKKNLTWQDLEIGSVCTEPGSSEETKTGDWRSQRPVFDKENCIRCGLCYIFCPDTAITMDGDGYPVIDLNYCKGCGICACECFTVLVDHGCFTMVEEEKEED